jgi:hypothetical protein
MSVTGAPETEQTGRGEDAMHTEEDSEKTRTGELKVLLLQKLLP